MNRNKIVFGKIRPIEGIVWLNLICGILLLPLAIVRGFESNWFWFWWNVSFGFLNLLIVWANIAPKNVKED
jgi:hypothetical protein